MRKIFYHNNRELEERLNQKFVHNLPRHLESAYTQNASFEEQELANAIDYFEFHYRLYVAGIHSTLHRVLAETRHLKQTKYFTNDVLIKVIRKIESDIIETELYELMPRHKKASQRVLKQTGITPSRMDSQTKTN